MNSVDRVMKDAGIEKKSIDEVVLIGRVQFDVPALTYGDELALTLTLTTPTGALTPLATNRYVTCARS